jgi:CheY-like chemotaxis protein
MIPSKGIPKILIVSNEPDDISEVRALIKDIKSEIIAISDPTQIVGTFDEMEPQILVLVSMEIIRVEGYYLDLYRNSQKIQTIMHNSLLVCKAKDAEIAYQMCLRKLFDDYVIIRPLFDPHRLTISIRNLLGGQKTLDQSNELHQRIASIRSSASAMDKVIQKSLTEGASVSAQLGQSEEELNQRVQEEIKELAKQMTLGAYDGVVQVIDQAALNEKFSQFGRRNLSNEIATAFKKPQAALDLLLNHSKTDHEAQKQANTDLDVWLNSIRTRILVVDDDPIFLKVLSGMLTNENYEVSSSTNAIEGLHIAARLKPEVILVDYEMPEMSGIDFTMRLKASPHLCRILVIMLTGHAEREIVLQGMKVGISGFLIKSNTKEVILQKLRSCIDLAISPTGISTKK